MFELRIIANHACVIGIMVCNNTFTLIYGTDCKAGYFDRPQQRIDFSVVSILKYFHLVHLISLMISIKTRKLSICALVNFCII